MAQYLYKYVYALVPILSDQSKHGDTVNHAEAGAQFDARY